MDIESHRFVEKDVCVVGSKLDKIKSFDLEGAFFNQPNDMLIRAESLISALRKWQFLKLLFCCS